MLHYFALTSTDLDPLDPPPTRKRNPKPPGPNPPASVAPPTRPTRSRASRTKLIRLKASLFLLATDIPVQSDEELSRYLPANYNVPSTPFHTNEKPGSSSSSSLIVFHPWHDVSTNTYNSLIAFQDMDSLMFVFKKFATAPRGRCTRNAELLDKLRLVEVRRALQKRGYSIVWDCEPDVLEISTMRVMFNMPRPRVEEIQEERRRGTLQVI